MPLVSKAVSRRRLLNGGAQALGLAALSRIAIPPARGNVPLRIGIQKGSSLFLLRDRGDLASALRPLGFAPIFTVFPGWPQLLEALNVGSVDFGHTSEAPPIFAQGRSATRLRQRAAAGAGVALSEIRVCFKLVHSCLTQRHHPGAKQVDAGSAIHSPLEHLQCVDLAFCLTIATAF